MEGSSEKSAKEQSNDLNGFQRTSSPIPETLSEKSSDSYKTQSSGVSGIYWTRGAVQEYNNLNNRIDHLETENERLKQEKKISQLEWEKQNLPKKYGIGSGKLEAELELLKKQKVELEEENARLKVDLTQSQADNQNKVFLEARLKAEIEDLQNELAECKSACQKSQSSEANLRKLLSEAEAAQEKTSTELLFENETTSCLQVKLEKSQNELLASKDQVQATQVLVKKKNEDLSTCEAKLAILDKQNATLQAKFVKIQEELIEKQREIKREIEHKNSEIFTLQEMLRNNRPGDYDVLTIRRELAMKNYEVSTYSRKIQKIRNYLNAFESQIRSQNCGMKISRV